MNFCRNSCIIICIFLPILIQTNLFCQSLWTTDPAFGSAGNVEIRDSINKTVRVSAVRMPDGKINVISTVRVQSTDIVRLVLTRLLPNGSRDETVGVDGQVFLDLGNIDLGVFAGISKILATGDSKLILCGNTYANSKGAAFVVRLNANGEVDKTFGQNGIALFDSGIFLDKFLSMLIKPDGKILLGGFSQHFGSKLLLVQLLPDGSPDPEFATDGIYVTDESAFRAVFSLALQEHGKIVTFGTNRASSEMEIIRFHSDGRVDSSFALNGQFMLGQPPEVSSTFVGTIQPDQKIVFCSGSLYNVSNNLRLFRLNPNGCFDDTFGSNGAVFTELGGQELNTAIMVQPDMKIIVGTDVGSTTATSAMNFFMIRYNTDGSVDETFGDGGLIKSPDYNTCEIGNIMLDEAGKITFVGIADNNVVLWRYHNDNSVVTEEALSAGDFRVQFSPNPVSNYGTMTWTMLEPGELCVDLFDTQGRLVKQLIPSAYYAAGSHQQTVYLGSEMSAGVYYLTCTASNDRQILKVVKY